MPIGKIKTWSDKGWGFATNDTGPDVFVHISEVDSEFDDVPIGTLVEYEIGKSKRTGRDQAMRVTILKEGI